MDAGRFAELLKQRGRAAGVHHLVDHVVGVERGPDGIVGVHTRERGTLTADLYVDCSGFRSLLLGDALVEPFDSLSQYLPNDFAVAFGACAAPRTRCDRSPPPTLCTTAGRGTSRCGRATAPATCTRRRSVTGPRPSGRWSQFLGTEAELTEPNHLTMRVGKSRRTWWQLRRGRARRWVHRAARVDGAADGRDRGRPARGDPRRRRLRRRAAATRSTTASASSTTTSATSSRSTSAPRRAATPEYGVRARVIR